MKAGKEMGSYKYLFKNIGLLTLSSFATKLLSFFLVPLYTNILTTTEYGTYDLFNTTIGVLIPILTLNIQESVMRFTLDKKYSQRVIFSVGVRYFFISLLLIISGLWGNHIFEFSLVLKDYEVFFFLMFFSQALSGIILSYIRGSEKIADLSISSVLASLIIIGSNILFLVVFKWGLKGYFLANMIGPVFQCIYLMIRVKITKNIDLTKRYPEETRKMLNYSRPMIANSVGWWVNNSLDRYVVVFFCGLPVNGIYSVASKIPSILNIFQSIFSQAWTISAVKDFDPEDSNGFFSNTYRAYNCLMTILCSAIIVLDKILAKFLYAKDFYVAWRFVPWLTIAIVFGSLSGHIGGVFASVKNSRIFAQSTVIGAVINIILNLILTPFMGALGAAIATMVCYMVVWAIRYWHSKRFIKLRINLGRDVVTYLLLIVQAVVLLFMNKLLLLYFIEILVFIIIVLLYREDSFAIIRKCFRAVVR